MKRLTKIYKSAVLSTIAPCQKAIHDSKGKIKGEKKESGMKLEEKL